MFYTIPSSLEAEIADLESKIRQFRDGRLEATALKVHRVPFGVYEQRKDNTYMLRIRCAAGALTPAQLRVVAEHSQKYGGDTLHITTRQELQIHDVQLDNVVPIMRQFLASGLSSRGGGGNTVRNITASIDSGVALDEVFDVSPYAFALTSRLIREPDSWLLPRKYKIAFSNSSEDTARAAFNDLGFIAKIRNGVKGFEVYVAGGMGTKPQAGNLLHEFAPDSEVYIIAEAVKRLFNKHGNRKNRHAARLRFLWNNLGKAGFLELYHQEVDALRQEGAVPLSLSETREMPPAPNIAPVTVFSLEFDMWRKRYVTLQKQPGLCSVLVPVFLGNLTTENAIALAAFLMPFGEDVLRATIDQNLCLRNVPEAFLGNVYAVVKNLTTLASEPRFLGSSVACTGASTCKLGICLPRGALAAVLKKLKTSSLDLDQVADLRMNLSGCPNTCGAHMAADLGFFGKVARKGQTPYPAYGIVIGGSLGNGTARMAQPAGEVSARDLPEFVIDFLRHYVDAQARVASFADYLEKEGKEFIRAWCERHREIPDFDEDKNYYYDWTATEVFSLAGRGVGECSAGLFDLIEFDLKRLKEIRGGLPVLPHGQRAEALYQIALSAARMLLITRAVEPRSDSDVFVQFRRCFVESGLVAAKYLSLVETARKKDLPGIEACAEEVLSLAQSMEELYGKMDNSLRFPGEAPKAPAKTPAAENPGTEITVSKDLRGVACPMNFVKTKLALEGLTAGQRLRIMLDDGTPIQNVPQSVAGEGHKILAQVKEGDHWSVIIQKASSLS
jgi:sulfite reductase (ferredoxin)